MMAQPRTMGFETHMRLEAQEHYFNTRHRSHWHEDSVLFSLLLPRGVMPMQRRSSDDVQGRDIVAEKSEKSVSRE